MSAVVGSTSTSSSSWRACYRGPGAARGPAGDARIDREGRQGDPDLPHHDGGSRALPGVGARSGMYPCRHGEYGGLLEAAVQPAGGSPHGPGGECPAYQAGPGPQDRCAGLRVDCRSPAARAPPRQLHSRSSAARAARTDPLPDQPDPGTSGGGQPGAASVGGGIASGTHWGCWRAPISSWQR
jgi:hypothetical protein